ncbi:pirin family protein [Verticiella alkaliphila]|uniref:pirin family protein n=1 Tax=Verticiella alkaliphila TaxID=2779529 RepID=UPI0035303FA5
MTTPADSPAFDRIQARVADVGGIPVHRVLPTRLRRTIGPWCFLDHAGPSVFRVAAEGMQVGAHPHIGLQTFTWMMAGELIHRDSLGSEQRIRPGQVNLMTAGRGISHTESTPEGCTALHAAQLWIALPPEHQHVAPRFDHYPELPQRKEGGVTLTLLAGTAFGQTAPTLTYSPLVGVDLNWHADGEVTLALDPAFEYGVLPVTQAMEVDGEALPQESLVYLGRGAMRSASAPRPARVPSWSAASRLPSLCSSGGISSATTRP